MANKIAQNIPLSQQSIYPNATVAKNGSINFGAISPIWLYFFNQSYANINGYLYTADGLIYADSNGVLTSTSAPINGQILIGSTGAVPSLSTISSGTGINISNGAGSITVDNTGVLSLTGTLNQLVITPPTGTGNLIINLPATLIAPGTVSATTYNVRGNSPATLPSNGLYLTATNTLAFSTNSTYAMKISSSQNLMIKGTNDTGQALQVTGNVKFTNTTSGAVLTMLR